jgi:hypothetical protein
MAVTRLLGRWRDRRARELYQRYGARPWHLLDDRTQDHYRKLVAEGLDGAGRPLRPRAFPPRRRTAPPAADY